MQIDLAYTGPILGVEDTAPQALAEGYTGLWTSETKHDPFLTLSLASRACPELEIGTGVAVALARSPYTIAQSAWDLATISGGKFRLGLGSQVKAHITRRFSMPWHKPVRQMRDMIEAIKAIWTSFETGERLNYQGDYYQHTLLIPNFNPGPRDGSAIPIGLAAVGPLMTELAGEVADFVLLHPFTNVAFVKSVTYPALQSGWERGSRSPDDLEVVGSLFAFPEGPEADRFEATIRKKVAFYGSTPSYVGVLTAIGREELGPQLHALSKTGQWDEMSRLIDDELLNHFRVRAPKSELFDRVRSRFEGLYDRVVLTVPGT
jgi:probable F420-dependent oxidoreductase